MHKRRMYLRRVLAEFPGWENLSNDELNDIRLYDVRTGRRCIPAGACHDPFWVYGSYREGLLLGQVQGRHSRGKGHDKLIYGQISGV